MSRSLFLEDFWPGLRLDSAPFVVTADDLVVFGDVSRDRHPMHVPGAVPANELIGHGPFGIARYFGAVHESGALADSVIAGLDVSWRFVAPVRVGAQLAYTTTISGWRRSATDPSRGIVHRAVILHDDSGAVVQQGTTSAMIRARTASGDGDPKTVLPVSLVWAKAVCARLEADSAFAAEIQLFDGTIGLSSEIAEVQLRLYRGRVIDITPRTPLGADFTLHADAVHWAELLTTGSNDLVVRAHRGEFAASGDLYRYLQLTRALHLIVDAGRALAAEERL